ncbi:catechol 2,3-dioxygenase-like lactoylglutathione lyase family enzyme [Pullulanibacillus pueri]|uniref:Glyoxalase/fosfomycin resistance/dioxygenase domain-containing protein n=1 Tax=Pullulanibacillus pueri TaxID=1437324 RepID=A0A8J2ZUR5_9BACL|nr:VOC family protein [Pullulanibacillus pueri]MBM7680852.1 catechol 2,3-dioxygenase-like lactoylglutathione lyase family enzyme [Pullulanibacillus pueri]GGH78577.1 hypothetical protein GCM10007096_12230 [Pullulanibacillus pueri]
MSSPILNQIGTVFIPVKDIEKARAWYCALLGLVEEGDILFGHLYVIPMEGAGIVLDSKIYSEETVFKTPAFHFNTLNIEEAYEAMKRQNVKILTKIEHQHYFNIQDPDGNHLMICQC